MSEPDSPTADSAECPESTEAAPVLGLGPEGVLGIVCVILVVAAALLVLFPGLGAAGLWSEGEMAVLDRSLAALGEPRSELVRSPWLPDQLRTASFTALGSSDLGLRLPGALAGLGLVLLTVHAGRRLGWSAPWAGLAGIFALATPLLLAGARTVLGNPTGELWLSLGIVAMLGLLDAEHARARRGASLAIGLVCLGASVASLGVVLGGALPLTVLALAHGGAGEGEGEGSVGARAWTAALWSGAAICGGVGLWLAWHQGEGYIPLLGAARDLELMEDPTKRVFSAGLEDFGYGLFPFVGLVVAGLFAPGRARWAALWLGAALVLLSVWSLAYGPTPAPVVLPAALLATAATRRMLDGEEPLDSRRLILAVAVLGALILAKDAGRTPSRVASPLLRLADAQFPGEHLEFGELLPALARRFAELCVVAYALSPGALRPREAPRVAGSGAESGADASLWTRLAARLETLRARLDHSALGRRRGPLAALVVLVAVLAEAGSYGRGVQGRLSGQLSIAAPLVSWRAAVEAGAEPSLGMYRIRDAGVTRYGPGAVSEVYLASRADLDVYLAGYVPGEEDAPAFVESGEPAPVDIRRSALIRRTDLPSAFAGARLRGRPFYVLDASHHEYVLVANFLPAGEVDENPLFGVLVDEAPVLAHETRVAWKPYVELVAWEVSGELHRGGTMVLDLVFEVQRPLPSGSKLYARLQKGKSSRVAAAPHELTGGVMPPNFWRAGDIIHHHEELDIPWLEVLPGTHELIVGLRRSEKTNLKISTPEGERGEHGVLIKNKSHEFAKIGVVELEW